MTLWPHSRRWKIQRIFTDGAVFRLHQIADLLLINNVISISVALPAAYAFRGSSRRQASVLLAAVEPHAPAAVFCAPFFNLYRRSTCSISPGRSRSALLFKVPSRSDSRRFVPACRARSTRPPSSTAIRSRFFVKICALIASGIGVRRSSASCSPGPLLLART